MPTCRNESLSRIAWSSSESIHASSGASTPLRHHKSPKPTQNVIITKLFGFYPYFLCQTIVAVILNYFPSRELTFNRILWNILKLWLSLWMKIIFYLPFQCFKLILSSLTVKTSRQRSVLISNGSTIQSLHLSRNFHAAGFRVVVCEQHEHTLALSRYSLAVSKFYTIPKPTSGELDAYIKALCEIVENENITYFIPVSGQTPAYFDACVKPHLELRNCVCLCPGISEIAVLDDILAMFKVCERSAIPIPNYFVVNSLKSLILLYDTNTVRFGHLYAMHTTGVNGLREKSSITLPLTKTELKLSQNDINPTKPWIVIQEIDGEQYLTCTTVKNSRVVANITCQIAKNSNQLTAVKHDEINAWLMNFFANLQDLRPINGHVTFRFVFAENRGVILPLSTRVGVSLPYIYYTHVHARLLCSPCMHFTRNYPRTFLHTNADDFSAEIDRKMQTRKHMEQVAVTPNKWFAEDHMSLNTVAHNSKDSENSSDSSGLSQKKSQAIVHYSKHTERSIFSENPSEANLTAKPRTKVSENLTEVVKYSKHTVKCQQSTYNRVKLSKSGDRSRIDEQTIETIVDHVTRMTLDKRSAIFVLWDPLPYCVYFYLLVPFEKMLRFLRRNKPRLLRPMTTGVR